MINEIPEKVRDNIRKMIDEANIGIDDERLKHMLTQICFEMYKSGFKEAYKVMTKSIEYQKQMFT